MVRYLENKNSGFGAWAAAQGNKKPRSKLSGFILWLAFFLIAWWAIGIMFDDGQKKEITIQSSPETTIINTPKSVVKNDKIAATIQGLRISNIELNNYNETKNSDKKITLLNGDNEFTEIGFIGNGTAAPTAETRWKINGENMNWRNADGVDFSRKITSTDYVITITDTIKNNSRRDFMIIPYARIAQMPRTAAVGVASGTISYENEDIERNSWKSSAKKTYTFSSASGWTGFEEQYWETIVAINANDQTIKTKPLADGRIQAETSAAAISIPAGKSISVVSNLFAGPKTQSALSNASGAITGINQTIDYGWFWFLARPFLWALNALYAFVLNYGLAIILLTIIIRIFMWPLTKKSFTGMAAMQKMQPELARVQKLYAGDKVRLQMEMMRIYKENKASPMSGCLPMLLQIPIFFALYKALLIAVPLRQADFLWIHDLATMDPYFVLPILMGLTMWWQQKLQTGATQKNMDKSDPMAATQKMMKWMPVLFTIMFAWMPSGLVLYWTISNLFGIGQMLFIKRNAK
ncbi:MAG: membrane protein insertase YidC [Rickettsiales bacterium]|jgi:YidC/Oxa1 family membrane protein insertase|nr:membrane protein insertase YidC [Rickettsiales bacterium]